MMNHMPNSLLGKLADPQTGAVIAYHSLSWFFHYNAGGIVSYNFRNKTKQKLIVAIFEVIPVSVLLCSLSDCNELSGQNSSSKI